MATTMIIKLQLYMHAHERPQTTIRLKIHETSWNNKCDVLSTN